MHPLPVRPFVFRLAAAVCAAPAVLIVVLAASALTGFEPPPLLTLSLLAAWIALRLAPTLLRTRLSDAEQTVLRFFGFSAALTLIAAATIGALPLILVGGAGARWGLTEPTLQLLLAGVAAISLLAGVATVVAAWRSLARSLSLG